MRRLLFLAACRCGRRAGRRRSWRRRKGSRQRQRNNQRQRTQLRPTVSTHFASRCARRRERCYCAQRRAPAPNCAPAALTVCCSASVSPLAARHPASFPPLPRLQATRQATRRSGGARPRRGCPRAGQWHLMRRRSRTTGTVGPRRQRGKSQPQTRPSTEHVAAAKALRCLASQPALLWSAATSIAGGELGPLRPPLAKVHTIGLHFPPRFPLLLPMLLFLSGSLCQHPPALLCPGPMQVVDHLTP